MPDMTSTQNSTSNDAPLGASPTPTPTPDPKAPVVETVSKDEHLKTIEKVRTEEKNKLYPEMQKLKGEREAKEAELAKVKAEADEYKAKFEESKNSSLTETQRNEKRLSDLEATTKRLESEKRENQVQADRKVAELRLELYREKKIHEAGIELSELVSGATPEEIDASVERASLREAELLGKHKSKIREDVAKELGRQLPGESAAPADDAESKGQMLILSPSQREELARIRDPKQYREARARLFAEAQSKLPDNHPFKRNVARG